MIQLERKFCLACGSFLAGRTDKKFCDDSCRTSWHNRSRQDLSYVFRETDSILRLNRKILHSVLDAGGETRMDKRKLLASGFKPEYLTRIGTDSLGVTIRYYYEFGLRRLSETEVEVFRLMKSS